MSKEAQYLLGVSEAELDRMRFQHGVWGPVTRSFLQRIGVEAGWSCLDVGAGPGFVTLDLLDLVGKNGSVTALDPGGSFLEYLKAEARRRGHGQVSVIHGKVEDAPLPEKAFDLVFVRWVLNFVPDRTAFLKTLARTVKVGGIIAVQDYWYEGLSVFPKGTPFDRMPDNARAYYRSGGGDASGIGAMPSILAPMGFEVEDLTPQQKAGGRESGVFRWASMFFRMHLPIMAEKGVISKAECDIQLKNFDALEADPNMIFFSPIILDCAMKRVR